MLEFRNKRTSEYRQVDEGSEEHLELLAERHPDRPQRPVWEQVGRHTREAFEEREATNTLTTTDIGDDDQPINRGYDDDLLANREEVMSTLTPTKDVARKTPTAGERAQGAGRAAEGKNLDTRLRGADSATQDKSGIAEDLGEDRRGETGDGGPPDGDGDDGPDYGAQSPADLKSEADRRGLDVQGTGKEGHVKKSDLVEALEANDQEESESPADGDTDDDDGEGEPVV